MPQFERFIDNLIEMRSHYSQLLQQSDHTVNLAQDSLSHINALLINELSGNQPFGENLNQMRTHYQTIVEENDRVLASARVQLNHIYAMLTEQLILQQGENIVISLPASPVERLNLPLLETNSTSTETIPQPQSFPDQPAVLFDSIPENEIHSVTVEIPTTTDRVVEDLKSVEDNTITPTTASNELASESIEVKQQTTPQAEDNLALEPTQQAIKQLKRPLLLPYQHLSKSEAVEKLLTDEIGNILHIDYIVRALYGELELAAFKAEKSNTYDVLSKGVRKGLWDKVPDRAGCYTSDLKLAIGEPDTNQLTDSRQEISAIALAEALPPDYQGLKLTQAVEKVLQENVGQGMNSEKVAQVLFGEAKEDIFAAAKSKIGKVLWSGANQGRWQGVSGKLGVYTVSGEK